MAVLHFPPVYYHAISLDGRKTNQEMIGFVHIPVWLVHGLDRDEVDVELTMNRALV